MFLNPKKKKKILKCMAEKYISKKLIGILTTINKKGKDNSLIWLPFHELFYVFFFFTFSCSLGDPNEEQTQHDKN